MTMVRNRRRADVARAAVSPELVARLVATQLPEFAELTIGSRYDAGDTAVFRLGDDLIVKLPRTESALDHLAAEVYWLGPLSVDWDFPFQKIVANGEPGDGFPFPWIVVTWLDGVNAAQLPLTLAAAPQLGRALAQVHEPAGSDAPINLAASSTLAQRSDLMEEGFAALRARGGPRGEFFNETLGRQMWEAALLAPEAARPVWCHGDLQGVNVLSRAGDFAGIIDWTGISACDPAQDLGMLYTLLPAGGVAVAWDAYRAQGRPMDWATALRSKGVALCRCSTLATAELPSVRAMGWRGLVALGVANEVQAHTGR